MIATLIIQELRSFFNTPFYWTLTTKAAKEYISCRYLFQLTASRRGWPDCKCSWFQRRNFNSQPHEEADFPSHRLLPGIPHFNSQPHEEADIYRTSVVYLLKYFNSQPHEEADCKSQWMLSVSAYFNSQPHEEADMLVTLRLIVISISTHSLTKRLTGESCTALHR